MLAAILAATYKPMVPLTICCLAVAIALGLGTGAVFKLVAHWFPDEVGAVTGVVGAAGGLGGFFPPLVMAFVKSLTGSYTLGFVLFAAVAVVCLVVLSGLDRPRGESPSSADGRPLQVSIDGPDDVPPRTNSREPSSERRRAPGGGIAAR